MLVDDNMDHTELIKHSFEDHKVANKIYHVSDGEEALDYLYRRKSYTDRQKSPRPHMILLDIRLPRINGLEVLREIKASDELKNIPVVILTASEAEHDATKAYQNHVNSYLVKPVDFAKFSKMMDDCGFYWMNWNYYPWSQTVS